MKKNYLLLMGLLLIFSTGCTKLNSIAKSVKPQCIIHPTSKDKNSTQSKEYSPKIEAKKSSEEDSSNCIVDVFTDSMFLNGNRFKLIKNLDAFPWEKKALMSAYKNHTSLWNEKQKKEFQEVLEEDKYLALCGDKRYYDNLLFTTEEPQVDILHSILLLKYINNLSNGCIEWVTQKVKNENSSQKVHSNYLLDMIEKDALVERLFVPFIPNRKRFLIAVREYKKALEKSGSSHELELKRLEIEEAKQNDEYPDYK